MGGGTAAHFDVCINAWRLSRRTKGSGCARHPHISSVCFRSRTCDGNLPSKINKAGWQSMGGELQHSRAVQAVAHVIQRRVPVAAAAAEHCTSQRVRLTDPATQPSTRRNHL